MSERLRLDLALERRGFVPSRARARDAIRRGTVSVNGVAASKPNQLVGPDDALLLDDPAAYQAMARALNPYGDGLASQRIVDALLARKNTN